MNKLELTSVIIGVAFCGLLLNHKEVAANFNPKDVWAAQFLPPEFRNINFTTDDLKNVLRAKCKRVSGVENSTLYKEIELSATVLTACLTRLYNVTTVQEEIETARPIGELDTIFNKYCSKVPEAKGCISEFSERLQPCLTENERSQNAMLFRVASNLVGFLCSKGGDQLAIFVAEEGPECLEANKEHLANCAKSAFREFMPANGTIPDLYNLTELVFTPEHCVDFERFEACTLHHLQQCREVTPANVAESMFKFFKNETNCRNWLASKATEHSILKEPRSSAELGTSIHRVVFWSSTFLVFLKQKMHFAL